MILLLNDLSLKGLVIKNLTDKSGRPVFWIRFAQYKRGIFDKERSKKYIVCIYELLDQIAGRNQMVAITDGRDVVGENINVELVYAITDIFDTYYPVSLCKAVGLGFPQFLLDIARDIMKHNSPELNNVIDYINDPSQLTETFNPDQIHVLKLNSIETTPKP